MKQMIKMTILFFILLAPFFVNAEEIDITKNGTLTIKFLYNEEIIPNGEFSLYKIADVDINGNYTKSTKFASYDIDLTGDIAKINDQALTIKSYIQEDGIEADFNGVTSNEGIYKVNIPVGLYIVVGNDTTKGDYVYKTKPGIVSMPYQIEDSKYQYNLEMIPKVDKETIPKEETYRKVIVVWDDLEDAFKKRPKEVEITLYCNDEVYDKVIISADDNWRHTWEKLPIYDDKGNLIEYFVSEKDIKEYKITIEVEDKTFIVTNKHREGDIEGNKEKLPNTGMPWWPAITLIIGGLSLTLIGVLIERKQHEKR